MDNRRLSKKFDYVVHYRAPQNHELTLPTLTKLFTETLGSKRIPVKIRATNGAFGLLEFNLLNDTVSVDEMRQALSAFSRAVKASVALSFADDRLGRCYTNFLNYPITFLQRRGVKITEVHDGLYNL